MTDQWPVWATQSIEIVEWAPAWEELANELTADLDDRLARWLASPVQHVGSTAVPGLAAKPIVDLMAGVRSLPAGEEAGGVLADAGWHLVPPELDRRPWRRLYVLPQDDRRLAHLHVVQAGHQRWHDALAFRDQLRRDTELVREYASLKRTAAADHRHDREAYTAAKTEFVERVVGRSDRAVADPR